MKKKDAAMLGGSLMLMAIFAYGLKYKMGWKYWVFTILILQPAGIGIGMALGKEEEDLGEKKKVTESKKSVVHIHERLEHKAVVPEKGIFRDTPIIPITACQ